MSGRLSNGHRQRLSNGHRQRWLGRVTAILAVVILAPCLYGFSAKFAEFVATAQHDELGVFAILPVFNYTLASLGFVMLMIWAMFQGMFRDIEQPKYTMLEQEAMLDGELPDRDDEDDRGSDDGPDAPPFDDPDAGGSTRSEPTYEGERSRELVGAGQHD
ncbi:hypothetical protein Pan216_38600 [Planctomycetes bacterium Pan216]|uniref:Uncharacterized protein n=1 Tax=Kolteria novifilia TaxID=2527975 RepID=A0A518B7N4_9BACT|nr:hypothetical protein Pan216_38600 [Planctomycetes bacterium Pan216]